MTRMLCGLAWSDVGTWWGRAGPGHPSPMAAPLTSGHHDVSQAHGRLDVLVKGWLYKLIVLLDNTLNVTAPLPNITAQPPHKANV